MGPGFDAQIGDVLVYDGLASVALGDTLLSVWTKPARRERIRRVMWSTEELIRRTPGSIVACQFLLSSASPPDADARADTKAGMRIVEPKARRLVTVPVGDNVWHGIVRTIIRGAVLVAGKSALIKVAANEREAFALLAQVATASSPSPQELAAGLDALYAALGVPRPPRASAQR